MLKNWITRVNSEEYPLQERLFVLSSAVATVCLTALVLTSLLTGSSARELLLLLAFLLLLGGIAVSAIRRRQIDTGALIISALVIFALLPVTFFLGGGIYGGAPFWFLFAALFVSLLLSGRVKYSLLLSDLAVAALCYAAAYTHPDLLHPSSAPIAYINSFAGLVFIGMAVCSMVSFAVLLYRRESRRTEQQKKEIEALNDAQSRFFSSMSHEIRTPINTIIGLNEMILREDVSDEVAEDAVNIQAASNMLLHLINDILDMSKLESGHMQLSMAEYSVGGMLSELVSMFWGRAHEKGLDFQVNVAPDVPAELIGDDVRIRQVLINVLNNAVKYTREGSVSFSIQCGKREGNSVAILYSVSDTGIGIRKDSLPYLFDAFKRVDEERNRHIEGTGLGLSIVKQLVDLMGGTITVNSVYTQGSTFLIELPQQIVGEETVGSSEFGIKRGGGRTAYRARFEAPEARVLVVDDNRANLLVVSKLLRDTRVQVETADSGEEALRMTQEKAYHVIFMDHMMPEMDGVECRRRILVQTGGRCREAKVIALTANADAESRALYEREGFDGCLIKPIDGEALEKELARQLPAELMHTLSGQDENLLEESMAWIRSTARKRLVAVTTESTADLPQELLTRCGVAVLPHLVKTERGVFRDVLDIETKGLLHYMADPAHEVSSSAADTAAHEFFFAEQLKHAHSIVHVALAPGIGNSGYPAAAEAAASFNNVTVVDSGHLSSGQGLQVLEACRLAELGKTPEEIAERLALTTKLVQTSFVVDSLDYLARAGQISGGLARLTRALSLRPVLVVRGGRMRMGRFYIGSRRRAWKKYIDSTLAAPDGLELGTLFITHAGLSVQELEWIRKQVEAHAHFDNIYFQKAAPSVSVNCGPGTFGLLFRAKRISR